MGKAPEGIAKPKDGERLLIRAPPGGLKSKWAGVPPRPAAPPPLPTNEKLQKGMVVQIIKEDEMVQATFLTPSRIRYIVARQHATHLSHRSSSHFHPLLSLSAGRQDGAVKVAFRAQVQELAARGGKQQQHSTTAASTRSTSASAHSHHPPFLRRR